jgi:protocatechuate 3,4-dioxygenase beta subunit
MDDRSAPMPIELDDDDRPVGRFLSRREILALFGIGGVAVVAAACAPGSSGTPASTGAPSASTAGSASAGASASASAAASASGVAGAPSCVVVPELTEGPFYVDTELERSDIRPDTTTGESVEGVPLVMTWFVSRLDAQTCVPLEGAVVDLWHCDALGTYSGVTGNSGDFLRGVQRTDAEGKAVFTTVYPGWYQGRAVHAHFKIRIDPDAASGLEATSQLFFDDELSREIFTTRVPYSSKGEQDQTNESDGIFQGSEGTTLLDVQPSGDGYAATFSIAVQVA